MPMLSANGLLPKDLQPFPRQTGISQITLKSVFRSTMVLASLRSQAHPVPFMGLMVTYVRSVPQMALTKARSNSSSESRVQHVFPRCGHANISRTR